MKWACSSSPERACSSGIGGASRTPAWVEHDGRRWLNTGDLGYQDEDGYFYLTGRKKELIIRGGHNIDPAAIEGALHRHPAVMMAAAIGRPDAHAGEVPVAYVQLRPGATATEEELLSFVAEGIGERAAVPKAIRIVDQLPFTAVGKLFKPALKKRETRDALLAALAGGGVKGADLVVADQGGGITVNVTLESAADDAAARRVLGQFPFPFSIECRTRL